VPTFKMFPLLTMQTTSGKQAEGPLTAVEEMHSVDIHSAPVKLLHRVKRSNIHGHRILQRSASGRRHHSNQERRGPAQPLEVTSLHHHHSVSPDKPLVRRKRIRRDGSTPVIAGNYRPALQQALAFHLPTAHRRPSAQLLQDKSKPKPGLAGKTRRRKLVHRRGRGHSLSRHPASLDWQRRGYGGHARDRKTPRPARKRGGNKTATVAHHYTQQASDPHPLTSGHHMYPTRPGKTPTPQPDKHLPDSTVDKIHFHPAAVHHVRENPRHQTSVSGSGERHRRLPVAQKPPSGRLHHAAVSPAGVSRPLKPGIITSHRRGIGQRTLANDG